MEIRTSPGRKFRGKVRCIQTGQIFSSSREVAETLKVSRNGFLKVLRGEQRSVGRFTFEVIATDGYGTAMTRAPRDKTAKRLGGLTERVDAIEARLKRIEDLLGY